MSLKLFSKSAPNLAESIQIQPRPGKDNQRKRLGFFLDSLVHFEPFQGVASTPWTIFSFVRSCPLVSRMRCEMRANFDRDIRGSRCPQGFDDGGHGDGHRSHDSDFQQAIVRKMRRVTPRKVLLAAFTANGARQPIFGAPQAKTPRLGVGWCGQRMGDVTDIENARRDDDRDDGAFRPPGPRDGLRLPNIRRGRSFRLRRGGSAVRDQRADHDGRQHSLRRRSHADDPDAGSALASIDPGFNAPSIDGGAFIYSEGLSATPEPSTWAMLLIGFAGLGFVVHRRARVAVPAA
jgi:hypothetical protein